MFQCVVKTPSFVSAILETPEVILSIPWALSLIVVGDSIQRSAVLTPVSRDDSYNMWVWAHDDPGVTRRVPLLVLSVTMQGM